MALTEFFNKINYQERQTVRGRFYKSLFRDLQGAKSPDLDIDEERQYDLALPLNFNSFLAECNDLLQDSDNDDDPDFSNINVKYLVSLIYVGLCMDDQSSEERSPPMQAANLFFTLCSGKYAETFLTDDAVYNAVLKKLLDLLRERAAFYWKLSLGFVRNWNNLLLTNAKPVNIERMTETLAVSLASNAAPYLNPYEIGSDYNPYADMPIKVEFMEDDEIWMKTSKLLFTCFQTLIQTRMHQDIKRVALIISIKLLNNCNNEFLQQNMLVFFREVLHRFSGEKWYLLAMVVLLKELEKKNIRPPIIFVKILNCLPADRYDRAINVIINNLVHATTDKETEMYLGVLDTIIKFPFRDVPDIRRQKVVQRVLVESYYSGTSKSHKIRETVMDLFIEWSRIRDLHVRRQFQQMFQSHSKAQISHLFDILLHGIDMSWKVPLYNAKFISFVCRMFVVNRNFITSTRIRTLEVIASKGTAHCLLPCIPAMVELIKDYAVTGNPVMRPALMTIINNALTATPAADSFLRAFFNLIVNCIEGHRDNTVEFAICNIILSDDYNCVELFKSMHVHNYIRFEHARMLMEQNVLKHPCSWKILTVFLHIMEYKRFPEFFEHFLTRMNKAEFFVRPEALYIVQVLSKIFSSKIDSNSIYPRDTRLAIMAQEKLTDAIQGMVIPAKKVNESIILLLTVNKINNKDFEWVTDNFKSILGDVLKQTQSSDTFPTMRQIVYLEQFFTLFDTRIGTEEIDNFKAILSIENQMVFATHEQVFGRIITLYGKICMKYSPYAEDAVPLLQHAMMTGPPMAQIMALSTLHDLCSMILNHYEPLYPALVTLIKNRDINIKNLSVRMLIKLVNDNHIRLSCGDFITLMVVLIDRNYKMSPNFVGLLQIDFIHRNQQIIAKYFISLLYYLNQYKYHSKCSMLMNDSFFNSQEFTFERRIVIYKFLFCNMERQNQMQILNALNDDFLMPFYTGRIRSTPSSLNVLRDVLCLICFTGSQYLVQHQTKKVTDLYTGLFENMKRDFFNRKRFAESSVMQLDKILEKVFVSLLRLLYKVEKSNVSMLPQFLGTIGLLTKTFYPKVVHMVHENQQLKNLYYELENCFNKHIEMIRTEPLDFLNYSRQNEWHMYLGWVFHDEILQQLIKVKKALARFPRRQST